MRQFHTAVVERRERFEGTFATQPHEVGWAAEAVWFVRIEGVEDASSSGADAGTADTAVGDVPRGASDADSLDLHVQVSVDGPRWLDEGSSLLGLQGEGDHFLRVRHFGGWLRLRGEVAGTAAYTLTVHLVLKE